ncbi:hypothetical protein SISNIDRAFT_485844 [Sistotremastrum niveocremeum HHB9708]|uniref:Arrestin-like N-terminal domain-containing protein n=1 Tax=Sistotremastrum niveocremeum HHB9708 TaxID=1314777 RepID=A0A164U3Q3_9AGAM|nr:hypothetical protein SISNIDRAFT_485844 [Sistotremastrum niveocremeum HHB9708]
MLGIPAAPHSSAAPCTPYLISVFPALISKSSVPGPRPSLPTPANPMSVVSLPTYSQPPPTSADSPAYTRIPRDNEQRVLLRNRMAQDPIPEGTFTKSSRTGSLILHLENQDEGVPVPVYNKGGIVAGSIDLQKADNVAAVDLKIQGYLSLKEIGGAGTATAKVLSTTLNLFSRSTTPCPSTLHFSQPLPASYVYEGETYALPPSYEVHLSGLPGFRADVSYQVTVVATKNKGNLFGNQTTVSTPIIYFPRARPPNPVPVPPSPSIFLSDINRPNEDWEVIESTMRSRKQNVTPIQAKLFIPSGRVFSIKNTLNFRLHLSSSALSLATFLPCSPTEVGASRTHSSNKGVTRVYVIRQTSVDVRNASFVGEKTEIFKLVSIGEASFRRIGDGPDWAAWEGSVEIDPNVKVGSFKAGGLWVKDCIILSIIPPSPHNSPLLELRQTVPIRLVTEPFAEGYEFDPAEWSDSDRDAKN